MHSYSGLRNSGYYKNLILKSVMVHGVVYEPVAMTSLITAVFKHHCDMPPRVIIGRHCWLAAGIKSPPAIVACDARFT